MSELVLGVNTVQAVETRVCNNTDCGVTFTPEKPSFYSCNDCFKTGFRKFAKNNGKKGGDKNGKKGGDKKGKKGGKAFQVSAAEVGSDNDGEDENSDSHEHENSETSESEQEEKKKRKRKKGKSEKSAKAVAHAQAVDILNAMDTTQRKKILKYFGSSTAEMCMQSNDASRKYADADLYFNTLRSQDQAFSSHTAELIQYSSYDEVTEVAVEEEISVQHSQPVVARLLTEMEERLLADNLDHMHGTEYAIEEVAQDMLNVSRRTQLTGQAGYSLSPLDFRNSIEAAASGLTRPDSRANAQELLIRRGYQVVPVNTAYQRTPFSYATVVQIIAAFSTGEDISPASLAHAINAYAAHEKIPKQIVLGVPGHFMLADTGATMHLLLCLILAFNDIEANRPVRGFNGSESICTRVAHLAFSAPVIYQGRQMDKSITSGVHDAYVTLDISRPIFSVARAVQQGHIAHFGGDTPGLYLNVNAGNVNAQPYIPFVKAENIDGVSGLKYFVPSKPLVKVPNMRFDIDMQEDTNGVFAVDEQVETNTPMSVDTEPENAD